MSDKDGRVPGQRERIGQSALNSSGSNGGLPPMRQTWGGATSASVAVGRQRATMAPHLQRMLSGFAERHDGVDFHQTAPFTPRADATGFAFLDATSQPVKTAPLAHLMGRGSL